MRGESDTSSKTLGPYLLGPNDTPEQGIYTGDAQDLAAAIPDESVDLILCDPPYLKVSLPLYDLLGALAVRVLRPSGFCFAYYGNEFAPQVLSALNNHLQYYWTCALYHSGGYPMMYSKHIMAAWKPVAIFTKGNAVRRPYLVDWFDPHRMPDKRYHHWGQEERFPFLITRKFTDIGGIVLDLFTGGGTVPAVCKMLGRHYLAFEIDPATAERARARVRNTQPAWPEMAEQLSLIEGSTP